MFLFLLVRGGGVVTLRCGFFYCSSCLPCFDISCNLFQSCLAMFLFCSRSLSFLSFLFIPIPNTILSLVEFYLQFNGKFYIYHRQMSLVVVNLWSKDGMGSYASMVLILSPPGFKGNILYYPLGVSGSWAVHGYIQHRRQHHHHTTTTSTDDDDNDDDDD